MAASASDQDVRELQEFMNQTRAVLREAVNARNVLFRESIRPLIESAWPPVEQEIEGVLTTLQQADSQLKAQLGTAGLSGPQLQLKLAAFNHAFQRFYKRGTLKLLEKVLS